MPDKKNSRVCRNLGDKVYKSRNKNSLHFQEGHLIRKLETIKELQVISSKNTWMIVKMYFGKTLGRYVDSNFGNK